MRFRFPGAAGRGGIDERVRREPDAATDAETARVGERDATQRPGPERSPGRRPALGAARDAPAGILLALWALARAAGPVLLILIAASIGALILNPLVTLLHRRGSRAGSRSCSSTSAILAALVGIGVLLADPISTQVDRFAQERAEAS